MILQTRLGQARAQQSFRGGSGLQDRYSKQNRHGQVALWCNTLPRDAMADQTESSSMLKAPDGSIFGEQQHKLNQVNKTQHVHFCGIEGWGGESLSRDSDHFDDSGLDLIRAWT